MSTAKNPLIQSLIKKLQDTTNFKRHSENSRQWFRQYARQNLNNIRIPRILREAKYASRPEIGAMYMYEYDPKHKLTLPYYDKFPLIVCFNILPDGWMGLNLHYLPPALRIQVFAALLKLRSEKRYRPSTKMKITYEILQGMSEHPLIQPCVKRYLTTHIRSKFIKVDPEVWEIVLTLPVERFEKASMKQVWNDSKNKAARK